MNKINFTKNNLDNLPTPDKGKRKVYYDLQSRYLAIRLTSTGHKSFIIQRKIDGKSEKLLIGTYPEYSIENARRAAAKLNGQIAEGNNPGTAKRELKSAPLLQDLFSEYIERHAKPHKKTWATDQAKFNRYLSSLELKKVIAIQRTDIQKLHAHIGQQNGHYIANRMLALLSSIFNCGVDWEYCPTNPAKGIKKFKEKSRDRFIQADELPRFFKALDDEPNTLIRDYIYLSLFTGARKANVLAMQWQEINFKRKTWRIPETKSGDPVVVPLTSESLNILKARQQVNPKNTSYVFPSPASVTGHMVEPKNGWARILKRAEIEGLRLHDLRRSLGSWQASTGASLSVIGKTLGHKNVNTTAIYARLNIDPVRDAIDTATDAMIKAARIKQAPNPKEK